MEILRGGGSKVLSVVGLILQLQDGSEINTNAARRKTLQRLLQRVDQLVPGKSFCAVMIQFLAMAAPGKGRLESPKTISLDWMCLGPLRYFLSKAIAAYVASGDFEQYRKKGEGYAVFTP